MFSNKSGKIIEQLRLHSEAVVLCFEEYVTSVDEIVNKQSNNQLTEEFIVTSCQRMKHLEETADELRHQVIKALLQGGFLVDSRKTTMRIIEGIDQVADTAEDTVQKILYERIQLESWLHKAIQDMNQITFKQLKFFISILTEISTKYDMDKIVEEIKIVEELESEVDAIENQLIKDIFEKDMDLSLKLHLKQLIRKVSSMSDLIEDLSDEVEIILASRRI